MRTHANRWGGWGCGGVWLALLATILLAWACQGPPSLNVSGECLSDSQCVRLYGTGAYCDASNRCAGGSVGDGDLDGEGDTTLDGDSALDGDTVPDGDTTPDGDVDVTDKARIIKISVTPETEPYFVGQTVTLHVTAACTLPILYRFSITGEGGQRILRDYDPSPSFEWTVEGPIVWTFLVEVKTAQSGDLADDSGYLLLRGVGIADGDPDYDGAPSAKITSVVFDPPAPSYVNEMFLCTVTAQATTMPLYHITVFAPDGHQVVEENWGARNTLGPIGMDTPGEYRYVIEVRDSESVIPYDDRQVWLYRVIAHEDGDPDSDEADPRATLLYTSFEPSSPAYVYDSVALRAMASSPNSPLYRFTVINLGSNTRVLTQPYSTRPILSRVVFDTAGQYLFRVDVRDSLSANDFDDSGSYLYVILPRPIDGDPDTDLPPTCENACLRAEQCGYLVPGSLFGADLSDCINRCEQVGLTEEQLACVLSASCAGIADCLAVADGDPEIDSDSDIDVNDPCTRACTKAWGCGFLYSGSPFGSSRAACHTICLNANLSEDQFACIDISSCADLGSCLGTTDGDPDTDTDVTAPITILDLSCKGLRSDPPVAGEDILCTLITDHDPSEIYAVLDYAFPVTGAYQTINAGTNVANVVFSALFEGTYRVRARARLVGGSSFEATATVDVRVMPASGTLATSFACQPKDSATLGTTTVCWIVPRDASTSLEVRYDYGFGTQPSTWMLLRDYNASLTVSSVLPRASTYVLRARVRLAGATGYAQELSLPYIITPLTDGDLDPDNDVAEGTARIEDFSCAPNPAPFSQLVTCEAATIPAVPNAFLAFSYRNVASGTWIALQDFSPSNSITIVPPAVGSYVMRARARYATSSVTYDDEASVTFRVDPLTDGDIDYEPEPDTTLCDDYNNCTIDTFSNALGRCVYTAHDDGTICGNYEICANGACVLTSCVEACTLLGSCGLLGPAYSFGLDANDCLVRCSVSSSMLYTCVNNVADCGSIVDICAPFIVDGDLDTDPDPDPDADSLDPDPTDTDSDTIDTDTETVDEEPVDTDADGVPDYLDNCIYIANSNQSDLDGDDVGDACDPTPYTPFGCADVSCASSASICAAFGLSCGADKTCTKSCTLNSDCPAPWSCIQGRCDCAQAQDTCPQACGSSAQCPSALSTCADVYGQDGSKECTASCSADTDCPTGYRCGENGACICARYPDVCEALPCGDDGYCQGLGGYDFCYADSSTGEGICSSTCSSSRDCPAGTTCQGGFCFCPTTTAACVTGNCILNSNCTAAYGASSYCTGSWWPLDNRFCTMDCTDDLGCIAVFGAAYSCQAGKCACD